MRQRTVREESTKDKAEALPPAIYTRQQDFNKVDLMAGLGLTSEEDEEEAVQANPKDGDVTDVTFVDDFLVEVTVAEARPPSDEYETDLEDDFSDREDEEIAPITILQFLDPSGQYPPSFSLDLYGTCTLTVDIFQKLIEK